MHNMENKIRAMHLNIDYAYVVYIVVLYYCYAHCQRHKKLFSAYWNIKICASTFPAALHLIKREEYCQVVYS